MIVHIFEMSDPVWTTLDSLQCSFVVAAKYSYLLCRNDPGVVERTVSGVLSGSYITIYCLKL